MEWSALGRFSKHGPRTLLYTPYLACRVPWSRRGFQNKFITLGRLAPPIRHTNRNSCLGRCVPRTLSHTHPCHITHAMHTLWHNHTGGLSLSQETLGLLTPQNSACTLLYQVPAPSRTALQLDSPGHGLPKGSRSSPFVPEGGYPDPYFGSQDIQQPQS